MSANEFRKLKEQKEREAHVKRGDRICEACSKAYRTTWWHTKGQACPKIDPPC